MSRSAAIADTVIADGWLKEYVTYACTLTHAPRMYHVATGLACISTAVGPRVWWRGYGGQETWPNLYQLILGTSGTGKTTAMKIGERLLRQAIPGSVYPDEFSLEAFIHGLAVHPTSLLVIEEFSTILEMMQRGYLVGLKELLTKLYDPREEFSRKLRNSDDSITIVRPSLSILGASTIDWLVKHLEEMDFRSGFMPRHLLWPQSELDNEPEPDGMGNIDERIEAKLRHGLTLLSRIDRAHVAFSEDGRRHLEEFVKLRNAELGSQSEEMTGMIKRIGAYSAKLGALLTVSDCGPCGEYEVDLSTAQRATVLIDWLVRQSSSLFEHDIVFSKTEQSAQRLLGWVTDEGVERSVLLKRSKLQAYEFERLIQTLRQRNEIATERRVPDGATRSSEFILRRYI